MTLRHQFEDPAGLPVEPLREEQQCRLQGRLLDRHPRHVPGRDGLAAQARPQRAQQRLEAIDVDPAQHVHGAGPGPGDRPDGRSVPGEHIAQGAGLPEAVHHPGGEESGDPRFVPDGRREHRPGLRERRRLKALQHAQRQALLRPERRLDPEQCGVHLEPGGASAHVCVDVDVGAQHGGDGAIEVEMPREGPAARHRGMRIGGRGRGRRGRGAPCQIHCHSPPLLLTWPVRASVIVRRTGVHMLIGPCLVSSML